MLISVILGILSLFLVYVKFVKLPPYLNQVPLVHPWYPFIGNVFLLLGKSPVELFNTIHSLFSSFDRLFQLWFGVQPVIGVTHPDLLRKVLTSGACLDKPFFYRFSRIDQGLWAAKSEYTVGKITTKLFIFVFMVKCFKFLRYWLYCTNISLSLC